MPKLKELRATKATPSSTSAPTEEIAYGDVMEVLGRVGESGYGRVSLLSQPKPKAAP